MAHEFDIPTLALVRDLFIFACFTALSFVDMKELTTDEIVEVNGEKWILSKRHKTNVPFQVKLLDIPLQIIERYKYCLLYTSSDFIHVLHRILTIYPQEYHFVSSHLRCSRELYSCLLYTSNISKFDLSD